MALSVVASILFMVKVGPKKAVMLLIKEAAKVHQNGRPRPRK